MSDRASGSSVPPGLENGIAVVGMAARFPGARTVDLFWRNLRAGVESIARLSDDELLAAGVGREQLADAAYVRAGAFLDDIDLWDAGFFGFNPREASVMDPQHRHFLECAWEALEHAGHSPDSFPGAIGVFAGSGMATYFWRNVLSDPDLLRSTGFFLLRHTGNDKDFLATRVSYSFDLKGPSVNVQTACSTSLVAIHMASQSLLNGECDMALAGGVTIEVPHRTGYIYKEGEILSPDGHCRPFDAAAAGTVFGSGAAVVVLRRLEDALASGDTVHALVRGSAVNNDGNTKVGYLAPSVDGQAAAIAEALAVAGVSADTISFVEAHGTGTAVGDPIEVAALTQAFRTHTSRRSFCALGSVKSNVGHLDTAAGAAGFIKAVQALKHGEIPPTLHFRTPHPDIDWAGGPFYVNAEPRPWPREADRPRRAGVSSLGVGGTNAHVVLEEAPAPVPTDPDRGAYLLPLSGRSPAVVERRAADLAAHLEQHADLSLADVAFTLSAGRTAFRVRRFVVAEDRDDAVDALLAAGPGHEAAEAPIGRRRVAFMFAGGGTQYPGMGRELYEREPVYRAALDRCLAIAARHVDADLRALVLGESADRAAATRQLERPTRALPALFATQYALAKLLMAWGIEPAAMIGHSMGEYTAACLSGVFTLEDAIAVVALRGRLFERVEPGAMTGVPVSAARLRELLDDDVSVAAENAPELSVASGRLAAIETLENRLREDGIECRRIHIDTAAHSMLLEPVLDEFLAFLEGLRFGEPVIPFVSNLSGTWAESSQVRSAAYWVRHLRETVRFSDGLAALLEDADLIPLEVGPGRTLGTLTRLHPARGGRDPVGSMPHVEDPTCARRFLLEALGRLWQQGVDVDWDAFWAGERRRRVPLPTYPFERESHWIAPRPTTTVESGSEPAAGTRREDVAEWFSQPDWVRQDSPVEPLPDARVVIFRDALGVGDSVADGIRERGGEAILVTRGVRFRREGDEVALDADAPEDLDALMASVAADDRPLAMLHLWNLDRPLDPAAESLERAAFQQPLELLRALNRAAPAASVRIMFVGDRVGAISTEHPGDPLRALLAGPARVAPRELPDTRAQLIDVIAPEARDWRVGRLADQLLAELAGEGLEPVVALRGGERWVQRFRAWNPPRAAGPALLREHGVYLITGGTGGLGRTVARHLIERVNARVVLLGRTGLPAEDTWPALIASGVMGPVADAVRDIAGLREDGADIVVEAADVTDLRALSDVMERTIARFGALHGVIHAAGTLDDRLIAYKSDESAAAVLAPKVRGTLALDAATAHLPLDFMVLFSSRSAVTGAPGQVDYTAANAFLDAFARNRRETTGRLVISMAWDAWRDVGMVAELERRADGERAESHPVLHERRTRGDTVVFEGELDPRRHWVVAEHRVRDGDAILPGSAYVDLARATWLLDTGDPRVEIRDLMLVAPLALNGEPRSVRMRLSAAGSARELTVLSRLARDGESPWTVHARGRVQPLRSARTTHDLRAIRSRCGRRRRFDGVVPHAHLAFGERWSALRSVAFGDGEAFAELELPESFAADLPEWGLHPALIDLATGAAQPLVPGYDPASDFYVPASYAAVRVQAPVPRRFFSHLRYRPPADASNKDLAVFDVLLMDEAGNELASFDEFVMVRMEGHGDIGHALASAPTEADALPPPAAVTKAAPGRDGIRPDDGMRALDLVLTPTAPPHVLVTPRALSDILAEVSAAATPARAPRRPQRPVVELPDVTPVETALAEHESVREVAALAHAEARDRIRIIVFVVYGSGRRATVSELRRYLRERLPEGLVPNSFVELEALPRTAYGNVDHAALPNPFARRDEFVPPRTPTERAIAGIWRDLLGADRVSARDNFLDIGGHSLLGVRALLRIEKATGVRLHPNALTIQTLAQLAAECDRLSGTAVAANGAEAGESDGALPRRLLSAVRLALKGGGGR